MPNPLSLLPLLLCTALALPAGAQAADNATRDSAVTSAALDKDDAGFVYDALLGGMAEVKASELALKRGLTGAEREFAQQMVDEHTIVNDELKAIATAKGVAAPVMPDEKAQKKLDALGQQQDQDFAEAYLEYQIAAHKAAVKAFKNAGENAKDLDVRAFAAKHLPHLAHHLELAEALEKKH